MSYYTNSLYCDPQLEQVIREGIIALVAADDKSTREGISALKKIFATEVAKARLKRPGTTNQSHSAVRVRRAINARECAFASMDNASIFQLADNIIASMIDLDPIVSVCTLLVG